MEDLKVRSCRICLTTIDGENYDVIDTAGVVLLNLDMDDYSKHVMCSVCSPELYAALKFKSICQNTEDAIISHVNDGGVTALPIDLEETYRKGRKKHTTPDVRICRLCLQPIKNVSEITLINDKQVDMIQKFVPEMNIFIVKGPVMCKLCLDSLTVHYNFLMKCWDLEQNIGIISNAPIPNVPSIPSLDTSVKVEDFDVKFEDLQQSDECVDMNCEGIKIETKTESEIDGGEICSESATLKSQEIQWYKCDLCSYSTNIMPSICRHKITDHNQPIECHKGYSEVQMYKCETCNYETIYKAELTCHLNTHSDSTQLPMYKCEKCDYNCNNKSSFNKHNLIHKNPSEVQMYKCKICNHETKYKRSLKRHQLRHKVSLEGQMYKCEHCNYETNYKTCLNRHILSKHKAPSEVQMYKCHKCTFETKHRSIHARHLRTHMDLAKFEIYQCGKCNYKSRIKSNLKIHNLKHKDRSEVQMYKCEYCDFETILKGNLKRHALTHKDPSEVHMYKCEECNFKTTLKGNLKHHMLKHKDRSEVQMYKCEECNFKTILKGNLKHHMLKHKDCSEVQIYKCEKCVFGTKYKASLKNHMVKKHHESAKIQMQ